jgi:hypothetical protein
MVAFKVMTTHPKQYLVRPNQDVIPVGGTSSVKISLQINVANTLRNERLETLETTHDAARVLEVFEDKDGRPTNRDGKAHKFLVQCAVIKDAVEQQFADMIKEGNSKGVAAALKTLWAETTRDGFVNEKLQCLAEYPEDAALLRDANSMDKDAAFGYSFGASEGGSAQPAPASAAGVDDIIELRKKYNEVINFTVQLTAERDRFKALLKESTKEIALLKKGQPQRMGNVRGMDEQADGAPAPQPEHSLTSSFSLWQIMVVALLAFLAGRLVM